MIIYQQLEGFNAERYYFCVTIPTNIPKNIGTEYYWNGEKQRTASAMSYDKTAQKNFRKVLQYD